VKRGRPRSRQPGPSDRRRPASVPSEARDDRQTRSCAAASGSRASCSWCMFGGRKEEAYPGTGGEGVAGPTGRRRGALTERSPRGLDRTVGLAQNGCRQRPRSPAGTTLAGGSIPYDTLAWGRSGWARWRCRLPEGGLTGGSGLLEDCKVPLASGEPCGRRERAAGVRFFEN
jgi:hypothetical protein